MQTKLLLSQQLGAKLAVLLRELIAGHAANLWNSSSRLISSNATETDTRCFAYSVICLISWETEIWWLSAPLAESSEVQKVHELVLLRGGALIIWVIWKSFLNPYKVSYALSFLHYGTDMMWCFVLWITSLLFEVSGLGTGAMPGPSSSLERWEQGLKYWVLPTEFPQRLHSPPC